MMYPEQLLIPMRQELTRHGIGAATAEAVDERCGPERHRDGRHPSAAARQRAPCVAMAMAHAVTPDRATTVFAGQDTDATERARGYFVGYPPSSPSIALLKDGAVVFMLGRHRIEGRSAQEIAADLTAAFDRFCSDAVAAETAPSVN
jgi:putative YphP/YqiW family bacilliredoxin